MGQMEDANFQITRPSRKNRCLRSSSVPTRSRSPYDAARGQGGTQRVGDRTKNLLSADLKYGPNTQLESSMVLTR